MLEAKQAIENPFGITVFGSAMNRVPADFASISASASVADQKPAEAFSKTTRLAKSVQDYLRTVTFAEFGVSRATLNRLVNFVNGQQQFAGYRARISFRIKLSQLDNVDEVAQRLVDAGANEIERITFETKKLKEVRAEARRLAIKAALEKAQNYCSAADVTLGSVLHIEDLNPMRVQGVHEPRGHGIQQTTESDIEINSLDASLIEVGASVLVSYGFNREHNATNERRMG